MEIYEQFETVVILREQYRVTDPVWKGFLTHLQKGEVTDEDVAMLKELVLDHPKCPYVDFTEDPWNEASLVTPQHGVRNIWNDHVTHHWCQTSGHQLFECDTEDTIKGVPLDNNEKFILLSKKSDGSKQQRKKELPNRLLLAIGMKVLVMTNIETDLDVANGARREIVDVILHPDEDIDPAESVVKLKHLPICVLVKLYRTRATALDGLDQGVIPIEPACVKMQIKLPSESKGSITRTVTRRQYPMMGAYAFTDYRSQGQTIWHLIVDIARPPYGQLNLFNIYVALSRGTGRDNIRILRDFDEDTLKSSQIVELELEDDRLENLDQKTLVLYTNNELYN